MGDSNSSYRSYKGSFSIVLTLKPRLHVAGNRGGFGRGRNCDNSYLSFYYVGDLRCQCGRYCMVTRLFLLLSRSTFLNLDVARLVLGVSVSGTFTVINAIQFNNLWLFLFQCIRKWLLGEQSTCPTCRVHALLPDEFPRLK